MDLHLRGKRVLITGASKGIGAAAAEAFAEEGCHLRLAARSGEALKALADRLRSQHQQGLRLSARACDAGGQAVLKVREHSTLALPSTARLTNPV